jgi:RNA polymerase-associated protein
MKLYSDPMGADSHRVRIVIAEKSIETVVRDMGAEERLPAELLTVNPYNLIPMMCDRDVMIYPARTILEYLDERFPHPPFLPPDPIARARMRLALYRIERDWYSLIPDLENRIRGKTEKCRSQLKDSLVGSSELFAAKPFFLSDEPTLVDISVAPILWRLDSWEIPLATLPAPVVDYAERLFRRPAFRASLSAGERRLRPLPVP